MAKNENPSPDLPYLSFITSQNDDNNSRVGLGFAQRDSLISNKETHGSIDFITVFNDKSFASMKYLIDIKNIFSKELPKMPKEYIVRLVFDRFHKCLLILQNNRNILGGVCYRLFPEENFAEIAFLAIFSKEQIKGYGTRLMNHFKELMRKINIKMVMTYADNYAIGYFKKQGFSEEINFDQSRWKGRIKDYDGGTLMECKILENINYLEIRRMIEDQKNFVEERIKQLCINKKIFSGIEKGQFPLKFQDIPGIDAAKILSEEHDELNENLDENKLFLLQSRNLINIFKRNKSVIIISNNSLNKWYKSWPFLHPVSREENPDYYKIIKNPIDVSLIEKRLENNFYKGNKEKFINDFENIFANARLFNQVDTIYYKYADELSNFMQPSFLDYQKKKSTTLP